MSPTSRDLDPSGAYPDPYCRPGNQRPAANPRCSGVVPFEATSSPTGTVSRVKIRKAIGTNSALKGRFDSPETF